MTSQILRTVFVAGCAIAALSIAACANLGAYVGNSTIDSDTLAVNADLLKLKADVTSKASATVIAADSTKLAADAAALDAAVKAAQGTA